MVNAGFLSTYCLFLFIHDSGRLTAEAAGNAEELLISPERQAFDSVGRSIFVELDHEPALDIGESQTARTVIRESRKKTALCLGVPGGLGGSPK